MSGNLVFSPKRTALKNTIREFAKAKGPNSKLPTVVEMCDLFNTAKATINTVLNDLEVESIIYRKRGSGIYVRHDVNTINVGLVFSFVENNPVSQFLTMLGNQLKNYGRLNNIRYANYIEFLEWFSPADIPDHFGLMDDVKLGKLKGVLSFTRLRQKEKDVLCNYKIPAITLLSGGRSLSDNSVAIDWYRLVEMGIEALLEKGCKRIGMITPYGFLRVPYQAIVKEHGEWWDDIYAYRNTLSKHNITFDDNWIWEHKPTESEVSGKTELMTNEMYGFNAMIELWGRTSGDLDGIIILDDMVTRGALMAVRQLNIDIDNKVLIATHTNSGSSALLNDLHHLIQLEVSIPEIVDTMFELMDLSRKNKNLHVCGKSIMPQLVIPTIRKD